MRVLALCPHFEPDTAPTGVVMSRLARELLTLGVDIEVVTSLPWYRHHRIEPGWEGRPVQVEDRPGLRIVRANPFPTDKRNLPARAAAFGGFTAEVAAWATT